MTIVWTEGRWGPLRWETWTKFCFQSSSASVWRTQIGALSDEIKKSKETYYFVRM